MSSPLLILGASARAAAFSARRAGLTPRAVDLFGDVDLLACCPASLAKRYPADLANLASAAPPDEPWMYTGALENYPVLVDQIAAARRLYGNCGETLRRVRDPRQLATAFRERGLSFPEMSETPEKLPLDGGWLRKAVRSSGGAQIEVWDRRAARIQPRRRDAYYQRRVEGRTCSAVYVGAGGKAALLGVTEQLIGAPWCGAVGFQYAGSLGPLPLKPETLSRFDEIGRCVAEAFPLQGLFGVDAVLAEEAIWPLEVNPRYTASVEVLERALDLQAVRHHIEACRDGLLPKWVSASARATVGKAILFAQAPTTIPDAFVQQCLVANRQAPWPQVADIPAPGTTIQPGRPIMTVFSEGVDRSAVLNRLREQAGSWRNRLIRSSG